MAIEEIDQTQRLVDTDGNEVVVDNGDLDPTEREALLAFAAGPPVIIENPFAAQPPRTSLLSSALDVTALLEAVYGPHWYLGFQFEPEGLALNLTTEFPWYWQCQEAGGTAWTTAVNTATGAARKPVPSKPSNVGARPFVISVADPCISTFGMFGRDAEARAKRLLEANLSRVLAAELWTGTRSGALGSGFASVGPPIINDFLTRNPTALDAATAHGYCSALAAVEQGYADRDNRPGFIHCIPRVAQLLLHSYAIEPAPSGRYFTTGLGNIVVADAGYPGTGTGLGASTQQFSWMYMTGPVGYARTPVRILTSELGEQFALERAGESGGGTNDHTVRAECDAVVFWDSKVNVSIKVDHTVELS